ncbi:protein PSK SIMULATOR 1-like [Euphorbia lathyris]|uniref:protein PSK SIMULATOR 1-like n=1 Tax=Euphorbia lathyris TaxID=212925 RepID=UPI00331428A5
MGSESWLSSLWSHSRKNIPRKATLENYDKAAIGVLAFEVSSLMSKVANLWHFLRDKDINKLREDIANSIGIQKLVSEDADYVMDLVLNEIMLNFRSLARSVGRLGKKCVDPLFSRFEHFINDPVGNNVEWLGWDYRLKKMERKVKKLERFVAVTMQLSHENEVLDELEQTLRRMQANPDLRRGKLLEFQQKVEWQRQEVRYLREMSPWNRTHDYVVRLLARSLLTILNRIVRVFEVSKLSSVEGNFDLEHIPPACLPRSRSFYAVMQSSIHPSENIFCGISSAPPRICDPKSRVTGRKHKTNKQREFEHHRSSDVGVEHHHLRTNSFAHFVYFNECMMSETEAFRANPALCGSVKCTDNHKMEHSNMRSSVCSHRIYSKLALCRPKHGLLDAPSSTLGHAALALRYGNVIVFIENLACAPHMIDSETKDELYNMLPTTIRSALRTRLNGLSPPDHVSSAAEAVAGILEWLSPLAHNTIRWHSERSFEREHDVSGSNVLLVQTLHYANQAKTEAGITELLVGLSYLCRINGDPSKGGLSKPSQFRVGYGSTPKRFVKMV